MLGAPYAEPAFAVLCGQERRRREQAWWWPVLEAERQQRQRQRPLSPPPAAHGVLHLLARDDWARVLASEGVVGAGSGSEDENDDSGVNLGYRPARVRCLAYDPCARHQVPAFSPLALEEEEEEDEEQRVASSLRLLPAVDAMTLLATAGGAGQHGRERRALPSRRYLTLLREGAREHGLSPEYRAWLEALACYDPAAGAAGVAAAGALAAAGVAAAAAPVALATALFSSASGGGGGPAGALSRYASVAQRAAWLAHDVALAPLLGEGGAMIVEERGGGGGGGGGGASVGGAGDVQEARRRPEDERASSSE
jgi:hypothetical protein